MQESDVPAVMAVEERAYPYPWTDGIFRDCIRVGYDCWVGMLDSRLVGYAVMSFGAEEAHLLNLCVAPSRQGGGLGRRMLAHVLRHARRLGAEAIFLEVRPTNTPALELYRRTGFAEIGRRKDYYPADRGEREDALVLALRLGGADHAAP